MMGSGWGGGGQGQLSGKWLEAPGKAAGLGESACAPTPTPTPKPASSWAEEEEGIHPTGNPECKTRQTKT